MLNQGKRIARRALVVLAYGRFGTRRPVLKSSQEVQRILLVRPDHVIAWRAAHAAPHALRDAVARALGHPAA